MLQTISIPSSSSDACKHLSIHVKNSMNFINNRTVSLKKMMAIAGLFWFFFLVFYLFAALTFHSGEKAFTAFYVWFNGSIFYPILAILLSLTLAFHVFVAVTRQLSNNISSGDRYKKPYPKACLLYTSPSPRD